LDGLRRDTGFDQAPPVDLAIAPTADENARGGLFLEKLRRPFRPFVPAAAEHHQHVGFDPAAVGAEDFLREVNRAAGTQQGGGKGGGKSEEPVTLQGWKQPFQAVRRAGGMTNDPALQERMTKECLNPKSEMPSVPV
jgi:hypothetical protein